MAKKRKLEQLSDLPYYREEYTEQLEKMGITDLQQLLDALLDDDKKKEIVDELDGVGKKVADHWAEVIEESGVQPSDAKEEKAEVVETEAAVVESGEYVTKRKPELDAQKKALLIKRAEIDARRPEFQRQEWFRYQKLEGKWEETSRIHGKMRRHYGYRPPIVSIGYRGPALVRGLHSSGFEEVMVFNVTQLNGVNPKVQAVRIGGTVGARKRGDIIAKADQEGIRVLTDEFEQEVK